MPRYHVRIELIGSGFVLYEEDVTASDEERAEEIFKASFNDQIGYYVEKKSFSVNVIK